MNSEQPMNSQGKPKQAPESAVDRQLSGLFDAGLEPEVRAKFVQDKVGIFVKAGLVDEMINEKILGVSRETDREKYLKGIKGLLQPIIDYKEKHPKEYEELMRRQTMEREKDKWKAVNQLVAYEDTEDQAWRLHILPNEQTPNTEKMVLLDGALKELARLAKEKPEIRGLVGTSWIAARTPRLLQKIGFEIKGPIDDETRRAHFAAETREIYEVWMGRDTLIGRYGKLKEETKNTPE